MKNLATIFKALSEETRIHMVLLLLLTEELCVCDFMDLLEISQSKASRHLRYIYNAGLLEDRRKGVWVHYRIAQQLPEAGTQILNSLRGIVQTPEYKHLQSTIHAYLQKKQLSTTCTSLRS